jgi:hypothetical protein
VRPAVRREAAVLHYPQAAGRGWHGGRRALARFALHERSLFLDTLAEHVWARDVAGLSAGTLDRLTQPVIEVCEHYGVVPWRLTPRQVDVYFVGPGKRSRETVARR